MNAVIMGCGMVGEELARTLVNEGHNVTVIDNMQDTLDEISGDLDVMTYLGNGSDVELLREAGIDEADIFLAVSPSDEMNLLASLIAREVADCETVARVRNPMYSREVDFFKDRLGLSRVINPERLAADDIYNLLQLPALSRIDFFDTRDVLIALLTVKKEFRFVGQSLSNIMKEDPGIKARVCAVIRNGESVIPGGDFVIQSGDAITVVAAKDQMRKFLRIGNVPNNTVDTVLIVGAGTISYYLTQRLLERGKRVRVIEKNEARCNYFSERFPKAEIIKGDGTDRRFLMKQGLKSVDAFIPLMGIDEENLVTATYAKNYTNAKVITKVNRTDLNDLIRSLDVDSVVFPKLICADIIAQYVRAKQAGAGGNMATLFRYLDDSLEILEFRADEGSKIINKPIYGLKLRRNLILAGIVHNRKYEIPSGESIIRAGDSVIVVTTESGISKLDGILA